MIKGNISTRLSMALIVLLLAALACGKSQNVDDEPAQVAPAGAGGEEGDILFQDDFQDGQSDGWEVTAAWYVQQAGDVYTFDASGSGGAWVSKGGGWSNYAFQTSARLDAGSLLMGFNLTKSGRYVVRLDETGLYLLKEYPAKNYTVLAQTGPVSLGEWHKLDIRTYNGHIQVYVDQALWVDYKDTSPLSKGTIAVTAQTGSQVAVDDVLVTKTGPLTSGSVQAPAALEGQPEPDLGVDDSLSLDQVDIVEPSDPQPEPQDAPTQQAGLPELHITSVSFAPNSPAPGTQVIVHAYVFNGGDGGAGPFTVRWYPNSSDVVGCSWDADGLPAGSSFATGGCVYSGYAEAGTYEWRAIADADNDVDEGPGEDNNVHTGTITVQSAVIEEVEDGYVDLVAVDAFFEPDPVIKGQQFIATYVIRNDGTMDAGAFTVEWTFHNQTGLGGCTFEYDGLPAGETRHGGCPITTNANPASYRSTVSVDVDNDIPESNKGNNEFNATLIVRNE